MSTIVNPTQTSASDSYLSLSLMKSKKFSNKLLKILEGCSRQQTIQKDLRGDMVVQLLYCTTDLIALVSWGLLYPFIPSQIIYHFHIWAWKPDLIFVYSTSREEHENMGPRVCKLTRAKRCRPTDLDWFSISSIWWRSCYGI